MCCYVQTKANYNYLHDLFSQETWVHGLPGGISTCHFSLRHNCGKCSTIFKILSLSNKCAAKLLLHFTMHITWTYIPVASSDTSFHCKTTYTGHMDGVPHNQACQFIAEIFSNICGPVKLEICAKNMRKICEICCDRMFAINWYA